MNNQNKYWYERINDDARKQELKKDIWRFVKAMIGIIILTSVLMALFSCSVEENSDTKNNKLTQEIKHDKTPVNFRGQWTELNDNKIIAVIEAETLVFDLNKYDLGVISVDSKQLNSQSVGDKMYTIITDKHIIGLSNGIGEYYKIITITIDNLCITKLKLYVHEETETPVNNPIPDA